MTANIVQAEFFHVGGKDTLTLEAFFKECDERVRDGLELILQEGEAHSGIKTVVRFYDIEGVMTKAVLQVEDLERCDKNLTDDFVTVNSETPQAA